MTLLVGAFTIGLILSLLAIGVYISFRVFNFPDITADGSITLGAAIAAVLAVDGMNPFVAALIVFCAGMIAGSVTGILHTKFKIHGLLSGILVMTALYSINLHIMGRSNIPLVSRSPRYSVKDITQVRPLVKRLREAENPVAMYVRDHLSPEARKALDDYRPSDYASADMTQTLAGALNALIHGPPLYEQDPFHEVEIDLRPEAKPTGDELAVLNRRVLDQAFPDCLVQFRQLRTLARLAERAGERIAGKNKELRILNWTLNMGKSAVAFRWDISIRDASILLASLFGIVLVCAILYLFFRTNLGTAMRATGDNPEMIRALGVNVSAMIILGLAISNGLIALSGALLAQYQGFADVQMGIGMVVWGLASVIIGEALVGSAGLGLMITGAVMGSVLFRLLVAIALRWGLNPNDLKLVTALFVFCALVLPGLLGKIRKGAGAAHA